MAYSDLNSQTRDGDYFIVVRDGLDVDTDYLLRFAWVFNDKDKGVSQPSSIYEFTTISSSRPPAANIVAEWEGTTLKISWDKTDTRAKQYVIFLTNGATTQSWIAPIDNSQVRQTWKLSKESNRANFGGVFRTSFTGNHQTTYLDGSSESVVFTVPNYLDELCSVAIGVDDWKVTQSIDGFIATWNLNSVDYPTYKYSEVFVEDPGTLVFNKEYAGIGPAAISLFSLASHKVKIRHFSESGCSTPFSEIKEVTAFDSITNDVVPPVNTFTLGTAVVEDDPNGLFTFDKKVLFTWTENASTDTAGYRIRFRLFGSNDPYTYMSVPGKEKTSTYLYGLKGGQTYEIGVSTFDVYGNTNETDYRTYPSIVAPASTELQADVAITAGDMKLGYGIGGSNSQKGLYLGPENYWYIQGNTTLSSAARVSIGGTNDKLIWDGSNLTATGTINANAGTFTGVVNIGTASVNGQLNLYAGANKFEVGRLKDINGNWLNEIGIQGTDSTGQLFQLDTLNGVRVFKGSIGGWTINTNTISKNYTSLNSDGSITAGSSGEFTVTSAGALTATQATIRGSIKGTSGGFGTLSESTAEIEKGWLINDSGDGKLRSTGTAPGLTKIVLDGHEGSITGGRIYGTTFYIDNPNDPSPSDYISSDGSFKLAKGRIDYVPISETLTVKANLVASNLYLGDDTLANDFIKTDGNFSLGAGALTGSSSAISINLNENAAAGNTFNVYFNGMPSSDDDGWAGDPTITLRETDNKLVRGRRLIYDSTRTGVTLPPNPVGGQYLTGNGYKDVKAGDLLLVQQ